MRLRSSGVDADHAVVEAGQTARIAAWHIPERYGDTPLIIEDDNGVAFLRFTRRQVAVNQAAPTWTRIRPSGAPEAIASEASGSQPVWATVSRTGSYGWIEPRLAAKTPPPTTDTVTAVKSWAIGYRLGEKEGRVTGVSEWAPVKPGAKN